MDSVINCYRLPDAAERNQALSAILSNDVDRKVVELWLKSHPVSAAESPMLSDLRHRITGAPKQIATDSTEEKILSGKKIEDPQELLKHIDLIKAHLELKTLNVEDLLPLLLDHAATADIADILKAANPTIPATLTTTQMLRLCSIHDAPPTTQFTQIVQNKKIDIQAIKELSGLNPEEKDAALAYYIESKKLSLSTVKNHLSDEEFLRLAPYLRYVDLQSFSDTDLAQKFLKLCPNLNILFINDKTMLEGIKELPLCRELYCSNCPLTTLPALPICRSLYCSDCPLTALPALPLCRHLYCSGCPLTALPPLPLCKELNCYDCKRLSALPPLPLCQDLTCNWCTALTTLPPLPQCQRLRCIDCPLTEPPKVPWNAYVVSSEEDYDITLEIDIEKLTKEPVSQLLQLGNYLLNDKPFPNILYIEKGKRVEASDEGGVQRDFVTRLCLNLFKELKLEDKFPTATSDNDEKAYRTLGCLLAYCDLDQSDFKTGPLFDPKVYQYILKPNPASDEWFLTNYLDLINAKDIPLDYLFDPTGETTYKGNREELNETLLLRAKQHPQLKAISWMAQELRKRIPDLSGDLRERVEGVLNPEALKGKLKWSQPDPKTQEYLATWIDTHEGQLDKFVYAVTGSRTLSANDLIIKVYDRNKNFIPVAHTCDFMLELSANYESQAVFDQKIAYFLENALAGSGFTMG